MHISLDIPEPLYAEIAQAAVASGQSVEAVVVDQLAIDFSNEIPAGFWTPERMAEIDAAYAEARDGKALTMEQVRGHFAAKREAWLQNNPA